MSNRNEKNSSIMCTVTSCKNHCSGESFCSLDRIQVGTHETDPAMNQCTDCQSFQNVNRAEQRKAVKETKQGNIYSPESTNY
jgi:hypothetical protein